MGGAGDDRFHERSPKSTRTCRKLRKFSAPAGFSREHRINLIIVATLLSAEARPLRILKRLWELPVDSRISGAPPGSNWARACTHIGNLPLLWVFDLLLTGQASFFKSVIDRSLAALLIVPAVA
jgi:CoA-binding protein